VLLYSIQYKTLTKQLVRVFSFRAAGSSCFMKVVHNRGA
ncbi:MAG: hypothetical protein ACI828_002643, partial [Flavobacteriales bacterium]